MNLRFSQLGWLTTPLEVWENEFNNLKVIPSSSRASPSRAVLLLKSFFRSDRPLCILDAGAGNGRNALYLAQQGHTVYALDFVDSVLAEIREAAHAAGLDQQIVIIKSSLEQAFPLSDSMFDLVLDSYVSCHFIDVRLKNHYQSEIDRVLKPHGQFFSSQFSTEDEYYAELISDQNSAAPVVLDPRNGVAKQLYSRELARTMFSSIGCLSHFAHFEFMDFVIDRQYRRSVYAMLVEK